MLTIAKNRYDYRELMASLVWKGIAMGKWCLTPSPFDLKSIIEDAWKWECKVCLRGIIPQLGFPSSIVYYDRAERVAGESKYPLKKMLALAWQGITSFSTVPLRMITALGFLISLGSFGITIWALFIRLFSDQAVPGWTSTVVPIYLLGGIQLLCIGIIGEYLAKIYMETKRRPHFFIEDRA